MARILVVDDTPQNLKLIELYLKGTEFEMVSATSGLDAIERCMREAFDLILLDVVMPGIDGFEACRRLKNDPRTAFVPVIFLTGRMGDESDKLAAYQLGAVDYIQKPVDREELVARIRVMLRLESARSRLDRENVALRDRLRSVEQQLGDMREAFGDLDRLNQELAVDRTSDVLVFGPDMTVKSCDAGIEHRLQGVVEGQLLSGDAEQVLGPLIAKRADFSAITVVGPDAVARELLVGVRELDGGEILVLLSDVSKLRQVERSIADRAIYEEPGVEPADAGDGYRLSDFIGCSPAVLAMTDKVDRLRQKRSTVLIYGESGTGKELVSRALHFDGRHRSKPFIPLHCGAIAPELIESELFGHEKGSFTGAQQAHEGLFRAADGGTIFLDEIAETSPDLQVKLLRVLQRGEIRPVGASKPRIVDVRIIAATNRDLLELVYEGKFREDLFYRLQVVTLNLPPLRERMEDLPALVDHFLKLGNRRHDRGARPVRGISQGAMERLMAYTWPGNVRELENAIEGAFAMDVGEVLRVEDLPDDIRLGAPRLRPRPVRRGGVPPVAGVEVDVPGNGVRNGASPPPVDGAPVGGATPARTPSPLPRPTNMRQRRAEMERQAIAEALRATGGDKAAAAERLGMARSTFYRRVRELEL